MITKIAVNNESVDVGHTDRFVFLNHLSSSQHSTFFTLCYFDSGETNWTHLTIKIISICSSLEQLMEGMYTTHPGSIMMVSTKKILKFFDGIIEIGIDLPLPVDTYQVLMEYDRKLVPVLTTSIILYYILVSD